MEPILLKDCCNPVDKLGNPPTIHLKDQLTSFRLLSPPPFGAGPSTFTFHIGKQRPACGPGYRDICCLLSPLLFGPSFCPLILHKGPQAAVDYPWGPAIAESLCQVNRLQDHRHHQSPQVNGGEREREMKCGWLTSLMTIWWRVLIAVTSAIARWRMQSSIILAEGSS